MSDTPILCVRRSELDGVVKMPVSSFVDKGLPDMNAVLDELPVEYIPRNKVENDIRYKQLIPYVVVRVPDEHQSVLTYYRSAQTGERRLAGLRSIGFGGHVEEEDAIGGRSVSDSIRVCAVRELHEEGVPVHNALLTLRGIVNQDKTPVGLVHFGLVFELTLLDKTIHVPDDGIVEPAFKPFRSLWSRRIEFEDWSKLIIRYKPRFLG